MSETEPLLRGAFMHHKGLIGLPGVLTLTGTRLIFEQDRLERLAGAVPWSLALQDVQSVSLARIDRAVVIETTRGRTRISGRAAQILRDRMQALVDERRGVSGAARRYEPGERVLLHGSATAFRPSWLDATGLVELTTERVRFFPSLSGRLFGPDPRFDVRIRDIVDARLVGVRRILELETSAGVRRLGGPLASPILTTLLGLREEIPGVARSTVFTAALRRGRLAHPGQMVVSPARVRFVTTGMLDAMVGAAADIDLPLGDVMRVDANGKALEVHTADVRHVFEVGSAPAVLDALAPLLVRSPATDEPPVTAGGVISGAADVGRIIAPWEDRVAPDVLAAPRLAGPALLVIPGTRLKRFVFVQTSVALAALPAVGPQRDSSAIIIRFAERLEPPPPDGRADVLDLRTASIAVTFYPRGGAAFTQAFWRGVPSREPAAPAPGGQDPAQPSSTSSNRRESYRVVLTLPIDLRATVDAPAGEEAEARAPFDVSLLNTSADGVGLALPELLPIGTDVAVELKEPEDGAEAFLVLMRVVHTRPFADQARPHYHGLQAVESSGPVRARLQRVWAAFQHDEVARRNRVSGEGDGADEAAVARE